MCVSVCVCVCPWDCAALANLTPTGLYSRGGYSSPELVVGRLAAGLALTDTAWPDCLLRTAQP